LILIDTNVIVYAINTDAPQHAASRALLEAAQVHKIKAALVPQVLLEFFAIVTDGRRVKKPLEPQSAWEQVKALRAILPVLDPGVKALDYLELELPDEVKVKGANIFDAFLVAQMRAIGASVLCTYNTSDFRHYQGIVVQSPEAVLR